MGAKMKTLLFFLLCFPAASLALTDRNRDGRIVVACIGNSITRGYARRLQEALPNAKVLNYGWSGATSATILHRAQHNINWRRVDYVIILTGANDWRLKHPSINAVISRTKKVARLARRSTRVLYLSYPETFSPHYRPDMQEWMTQLSAAQVAQLSALTFPFWQKEAMLALDGIHPNANGYAYMAFEIAEALRK